MIIKEAPTLKPIHYDHEGVTRINDGNAEPNLFEYLGFPTSSYVS